MYTHISNPPFSSSILRSYFAIRGQHLLSQRSKSVFLFLLSLPNNSHIFFSWFLSLVSAPCKNDIRATASRYKETADLLT